MEKVRGFYGAKYLIPYSRSTYLPYGVFRVLQEINFERSVEFTDLLGGDAQGPWDSEMGQPENSLSVTLREYPGFAFSLFEDATVTTNAAETGGNVGTLTNKNGTTVMSATTGIASIAAKAAKQANLPAGRLVFKATDTTKVTVYLAGSPKGDGAFSDINGKVVAEITLTGTGATQDLDDVGITVTEGSGSPALTVGDTAYSDIRPVNNGNVIIDVGGQDVSATEFGAFIVWPQKSDGSIFYADIFRIKSFGLPWKAVTREWSEYQLTGKVLIDTDNSDKLYRMYQMLPDA